MSFKASVLSGLFSVIVSSAAMGTENHTVMSEAKPQTPKMPADVPTAPINPPIRRTNILDVMNRPAANRKERRHGIELI